MFSPWITFARAIQRLSAESIDDHKKKIPIFPNYPELWHKFSYYIIILSKMPLEISFKTSQVRVGEGKDITHSTPTGVLIQDIHCEVIDVTTTWSNGNSCHISIIISDNRDIMKSIWHQSRVPFVAHHFVDDVILQTKIAWDREQL